MLIIYVLKSLSHIYNHRLILFYFYPGFKISLKLPDTNKGDKIDNLNFSTSPYQIFICLLSFVIYIKHKRYINNKVFTFFIPQFSLNQDPSLAIRWAI